MPKNYITEKEWLEAKSKQEKHQEYKKSVHEKIMRGLKNLNNED